MRNFLEEKIADSIDKIRTAAEISQAFYGKPLIITYSGGKDSDVLLHLAIRSGIKFEVVNSHTTLDAPQTVYHIRKTKDYLETLGIKMTIIYPEKDGKRTSMWELIEDKGLPPTRIIRYCCRILKETSIPNRLIALGVRREESSQRRTREDFEIRGDSKKDVKRFSLAHTKDVFDDSKKVASELGLSITDVTAYDCTLIKSAKEQKDIMVNPIIDWTFSDVWQFINEYKIPYNPLYDMGYERVGCIGCPMASYKQKCKQFHDFPAYKRNYIAAFDRLLRKRRDNGNPLIFKNGKECLSGEELFSWWVEEEKYGTCKGQMTFTFDDDNNINIEV